MRYMKTFLLLFAFVLPPLLRVWMIGKEMEMLREIEKLELERQYLHAEVVKLQGMYRKHTSPLSLEARAESLGFEYPEPDDFVRLK